MTAARWARWLVRALLPRDIANPVLGDLERERAQRGAGSGWLVLVGIGIAIRLWAGHLADSLREWTGGGLAGISNDVRYALRGVRRSGALLVLATGVLALGIAAPTTMYSIGRGLMRDLPVPEPDRLVHIGYVAARGVPSPIDLRPEDLAALRARGGLAGTIAGYRPYPLDLTSEGREAQRVDGAQVTPDLFRVLRTPPVMGRDFVPEDGHPGAPPVALIGERLWRTRFDSNPSTVGHSVNVNGVLHTVVGIMPEHVRFPAGAELWVPVSLTAYEPIMVLGGRIVRGGSPRIQLVPVEGIARIPDGESFERFDAELNGLMLPERYGPATSRRVVVSPYALHLFSLDARLLFRAVLALMGCLLFVACANVANLLLARAVFRERETAIRIALGAGRARIILHHLAEATAVAVIGGTVAILLTRVALASFAHALSGQLQWFMEIRLDGWTLAFATLVSAVAAIVAGVLPGVQLTGRYVGALGTGTRAGTEVRIARLTHTLMLVQVTISTIALTVAALVLREVSSALPERRDYENAVRPVLMATYQGVHLWPEEKYDPRAFHRRVHEALSAQPNVAAAALVGGSLPGWSRVQRAFRIEGIPLENGREPVAQIYEVSPGYLAVMGAPILRGRDLTWTDGETDPPAVLVNERFSTVFLGGKDPIGMQVWVPGFRNGVVLATIVGVVPVINEIQPLTNGAAIYRALGDATRLNMDRTLTMLARVRQGEDPGSLAPSLHRAMASVDPDRPLFSVRTLADQVEHLQRPVLFLRTFFFFFGASGLFMAATGLYGVVSFGVARRTNEIGIRVALGAARHHLAWSVVRSSALRVLLGGAVGLIGVRLGARGFVGFLGLSNLNDPVPYASVLIILGITAFAAAAVPLRRALAIQPTEALRTE